MHPSKYLRDNLKKSQDRRDTILAILILVVFGLIMVVEYSGIADKFINLFA